MIQQRILLTLLLAGSLGITQAQTALEKADAAFKMGDYKQAVEQFEQGLATSNDLNALLNLAMCYRALGSWQKTEATYAKAMANPLMDNANMWGHWYYYAEALKNNGKYADAKKCLEKANIFSSADAKSAATAGLAGLAFAEKNKNTPSPYKLKAESEVNTASAEFAPVFFKDKVVFGSTRVTQLLMQGGYSVPDINNYLYVSQRSSNGSLAKPSLFLPNDAFGSDANLAPISFTQDGKNAVTTFNSFREGYRHLSGVGMSGLSKLELNMHSIDAAGVLSKGEAFAHNISTLSTGFPALSADGKTMILASERDDKKGFDLYVCYYQNGTWTKPQNLGANINTMGHEIAPFLAADGKTLYFASDFHKGFGGYDIFVATLNAQGVWGDVRNLGFGINSSYDDLYFAYDIANNVGYFSSNRTGGAGDYDIYSCVLMGDMSQLQPVNDQQSNVAVTPPNNGGGTPNPFGDVGGGGGTTPPNNGGGTPNPFGDVGGGGGTTPPNNGGGTPNPFANVGGGGGTTPPNNGGTTTQPNIGGTSGTGMNGKQMYFGGVVDGSTQQPLSDVAIFLKNEKTQITEKIFTDKFGQYSVYLDLNTAYSIVLSKAGYQNLSFNVETADGMIRTILGSRGMQATIVNNNAFQDITTNPNTPIQNNWGGGTTTTTTTTTTTPSTPANSPMDFKYSYAPSKPIPAKGYYVQIGVFSKLPDAKKEELRQYGNLYTEDRGTSTVYKLGIYADVTHAKSIVKDMNDKGYTGAYLIPTDLDSRTLADKLQGGSQLLYPPGVGEAPFIGRDGKTNLPIKENTQNDWADNNSGTLPIKENTQNDWADNDGWKQTQKADNLQEFKDFSSKKGIEFKVQIGAFQEPEKALFPKLDDLGKMEKQPRATGLTHFYLAGFASLDEARRARAASEERGVEAPFVVAFKDGKRIEMKDALMQK